MANVDEQTRQQIPQHTLVLRDFCIRAAGADCMRCVDVCPAGAINFAGHTATAGAVCEHIFQPPQIDASLCSMCGICQGICDAFTSTDMKVADVAAAVRRLALSAAGRDIVLTCKHNLPQDCSPASNVVVVPCLAMLPTELWAQLLAEKANLSVALDLGICEECPNCTAEVPAEAIYSAAISQAETWAAKSIGFAQEVPAAADEGLFANLARAGASGSKRDAFSDVLFQLKEASSGDLRKRTDLKLQRFIEQNDRLKSRDRLNLGTGSEFNQFATRGRARTIMMPTRQMLLAAIKADPEIADRVTLALSTTNPEYCEEDMRCAKACPTGARRPDATDGSLIFEARLCIGCGICESVCRHGAIDLVETNASELAC